MGGGGGGGVGVGGGWMVTLKMQTQQNVWERWLATRQLIGKITKKPSNSIYLNMLLSMSG